MYRTSQPLPFRQSQLCRALSGALEVFSAFSFLLLYTNTNFFITLKTIKGMECASLMPIDLFFEAPCPMDSCNYMDDHPPHTRDVRWYNIRLYSTYVRWKRIMHYSTHEELMFVNLCLLWSYSRWPRSHLARSYVNALCIRVGDK